MTRLRSTEIAATLSAAMAERRLVRLTTRFDRWGVCGYVVGMGPGFVMVAIVSDRIWFDGFECFRRPDIVAVEDDPYAEFHETALARRGETLPDAPPVSLASIEELLTTAARAFPLVTIHIEEIDPDVCYIGRVCEIAGGELVMRDVTPAAKWATELDRYATVDITRVAFGGGYEDALALVANEPPSLL